ncbi:MAG TPA: hypothetical protein VN829_16425 [Dongiaceae bacterium]|nr:hypothetical protein [Dongiaceae bacterium]
MKRTVDKLIMAGVGLLTASAAANLRAQGSATPAGPGVPLTLAITATATVQGADSSPQDNGKTTTTTSKTTTLKLSTANILQLIAAAEGTTFSSKAKLVYQGGSVSVVDGTNTTDVSADLTVTLDPNSSGVWSGTDSTDDNTSAETQKYSGSYVVTVSFDDGAGDSFNISGLATESYSIGAPDKNGNQKGSDSISMNLSGDGQYGGSNGVLSGTIKATGSGAISH